jgi:hypothetical protein
MTGWTDKEVGDTSGAYIGRRRTQLSEKNEGLPEDERLSREQMDDLIVAEMRARPVSLFVMDGSGQFHVTQGEFEVTHHSSMIGARNVAAAGEIAMEDGQPVYLSDVSGHFRMPHAQTWQAVKQLQLDGFDVGRLELELFGVDRTVTGAWFLRHFDPTVGKDDPRYLPMSAGKLINKMLEKSPPSDDDVVALAQLDAPRIAEPEEDEIGREEEEVAPRRKKKGVFHKLKRFGRRIFGGRKE